MEKKYAFRFLKSILIILFSFELIRLLDFTIVEPPKNIFSFLLLLRIFSRGIVSSEQFLGTFHGNAFDVFFDEDDDL